jgi:hypothetical protein
MAEDRDVAEILFSQPSPPQIETPSAPPIPPNHHRVYTIYDSTPGPRHNQSIFLESNVHGTGSGTLFHVIGSLNKGMIFETRVDLDPTQSPSFESRVFLGSVLASEGGLERFEEVCRAVEVPGKQVRRNGVVIERGRPVRGGKEWVAEVVAALYREGVVVR